MNYCNFYFKILFAHEKLIFLCKLIFMENLYWFNKWFSKEAIENIQYGLNVKFQTITNSSWFIEIDLSKTKYHRISDKEEHAKSSEFNWYDVQIKDKVFIGKGDFTKFDFLIGKFAEFIGEKRALISLSSDNFFSTDIQDFIFENTENCLVFLHYTNSKEVADNIINKGFRFSPPFDKTTINIKKDDIILKYNHYVLKSFGNHVIVICVSRNTYNKYQKLIKDSEINTIDIEEVLSDTKAKINSDNEKIFTLHRKFVKGYFNYIDCDIVKNPDYDSNYDSIDFEKNLNPE